MNRLNRLIIVLATLPAGYFAARMGELLHPLLVIFRDVKLEWHGLIVAIPQTAFALATFFPVAIALVVFVVFLGYTIEVWIRAARMLSTFQPEDLLLSGCFVMLAFGAFSEPVRYWGWNPLVWYQDRLFFAAVIVLLAVCHSLIAVAFGNLKVVDTADQEQAHSC